MLEEKEARRDEEARMAAGGERTVKGEGQQWEDERRNYAAPPSARFSGRITGAPFPRDPRRNAKRGLARTDGMREREREKGEREGRDVTTIHLLPPYCTIVILFTPLPHPFRRNQRRE